MCIYIYISFFTYCKSYLLVEECHQSATTSVQRRGADGTSRGSGTFDLDVTARHQQHVLLSKPQRNATNITTEHWGYIPNDHRISTVHV